MATDRYFGPASTLDGKAVPADGLVVTYSEDQKRIMRDRGHRFASDAKQARKPTPQAVDDAFDPETGAADLTKAVRTSARTATEADKP